MDTDKTGVVTELRARGYAVLPTPRQVELEDGSVRLDAEWKLALDKVDADDVAVRTLRSALASETGLELESGKAGGGQTILLAVRPGAVETNTDDPRDEQAYLLRISTQAVEVVGNAPAGLFYGVQTLAQLLAGDGRQPGLLPAGVIRDWPSCQLRVIHWDTKHHQDRVETLKRYLDWTARFKANAIAFELEDKFEYPSHPIIGAPQAFTTEQMQELTRYALERYIQIIPNVQAPAHLGYVLKHEEFAHLRCDESNYQICMDEPEARKLIFDMYEDACEATPGVEYFHVSTDEVYYAGICEKFRRPYNPENRSLTWVDFVNAAHEFLSKRGRRVLIWLEYPLLAEHVKLLPPDVLDGIASPGKSPAHMQAEAAHGIRQFAYCPIQGMEMPFPSYFDHAGADGRLSRGRLSDAVDACAMAKDDDGQLIGNYVTAWDDSGLHNETFWLGWAVMAAGGWTPGAAVVEQTVAEFMDLYYGRDVTDMVEVYRDLQAGGRFFQSSWDSRPSKVRGPGYGYSGGKRPVGRSDMTLLPPALPQMPDLAFTASFSSRYEGLLAEAPGRLAANDRLLARLQANLPRASRNRLNLEVFLALAYFQRHHLRMLLGLAGAERTLTRAAAANVDGQPAQAVGSMLDAHAAVGRIIDDLEVTYRRLVTVWEKSCYPRNAPAGGREFIHVMDDVKDHFADRRADMSYMIAPEQSVELPQWRQALGEIIHSYAAAHGVPVAGLEEEPMDD